MKKLAVTSYTPDEIRAIIKSKDDYKIATRLLCMLQIAKGGSSRQTEQLMVLSHNQICQWVKRFNEHGIDGLQDIPKSGRKAQLSDDQIQRIGRIVLNKSPEDVGYNSATWTAPILVKWIRKEFGITFSDDNIYRILKDKLKLRHKRGKGFYPESSTSERRIFVEQLKKTPRS